MAPRRCRSIVVILPLLAALTPVAVQTQASSPRTSPPANERKPDMVLRLWEGDAPGTSGSDDADVPTLSVFRPDADRSSGAAVVICPGGGYAHLAPHEGNPVAQWLNTIGVTGLVFKYRLGPKYHHPAMLSDVSRAIRTARFHAVPWKIDPRRLGVLGFSAGGHLASTVVTHFDDGDPNAADPIDRLSSRPDFGVLVYPVITMTDPYAHRGSRENLLGKNPPRELIDQLSSEMQVTDRTPPCFLVHTSTDTVVPFENSLMFARALNEHHVPVELHVFDHGPHGFGLGGGDPVLAQWPRLCAIWMERHGWLGPEK